MTNSNCLPNRWTASPGFVANNRSKRYRDRQDGAATTELLQARHAQEARGQYHLVQGGLAPWQAKRVAAYVESNFSLNIRIADLANSARLSYFHFSKTFKKSFGETPHAYVARYRVGRAQLIMLNSRAPLTQIAHDCGMCDQSHFTRLFRKIVGVNPRAWRRQFSTGPENASVGNYA